MQAAWESPLPQNLLLASYYRRSSPTLLYSKDGEPGTNWASPSIRITLIKASGSKVYTDYELLKLSSTASVLSGTVLRDQSLTAITKLLVHYIKNFESSHNVFLQKARITGFGRAWSRVDSYEVASGQTVVAMFAVRH